MQYPTGKWGRDKEFSWGSTKLGVKETLKGSCADTVIVDGS